MDKQQLQQQINEMKAKLAKMEALLNQSIINYWQPENNEKYFYVNELGNIDYSRVCLNLSRYRIFKTQAEAAKYADYIKAEETLRKAIATVNKGWMPDWNTHIEEKWCIELKAGLYDLKEICSKSYKAFPTFMYIKSGELSTYLINTYRKEFITYLSY